MKEREVLSVLIFDGGCGFCTKAAQWAAKGWSGTEQAIPWQVVGADGLERLGLDESRAQEKAWWVDVGGDLSGGHQAVAKALYAGGGWRRLVGTILLTPPFSLLAASGYLVVARYRHRLPGGTPACRFGA